MIIPFFRNSYRISTYGWSTEKLLVLNDFSGGINNVQPVGLIADNESCDCMNMRFTDNNLMAKRQGLVPVLNDIQFNNSITWIDEYKPFVGSKKRVLATSEKFYVDGVEVCNVSGDVRGVNYYGKYFFVDGSNIFVYDGDTYYIIVQPIWYVENSSSKDSNVLTIKFNLHTNLIPTVGGSVYIINGSEEFTSSITDVSDLGDNKYTLTLQNPLTFDVAKDSIIYSFIPSPSGVFYGSEVWDKENHIAYYKPCKHELEYAYLGTPYIPDSPNVITIHLDRLFIAGDSSQPHGIYLSKTNEPLYFPSGAGLGVVPDGEPIVDLVVFDSALIIGRHKDMFALYGSSEYADQTDDPFYIKKMDVSIGFMSTDCGALLNNYYIYLGYDGRFYKLNTPTTYVEYLMTRPCSYKCDIYSHPFSLKPNIDYRCSTISFYNEIYFNIGTNLTIVYNYDNMAWTYFTGWNESCLYTDSTKFYVGTVDGRLAEWDCFGDTYNDLGKPIESHYYTKNYSLINPVNYKYFKNVLVTSYIYEDMVSNIDFRIYIDGIPLDLDVTWSSSFPLFDISAYFDRSYFLEPSDDYNALKTPWMNIDVRGRTIQFRFENNSVDEAFSLSDINLCYFIRDVR